MSVPHTDQTPSDWVRRWAHLIPDRAGGALVLDVACGYGRHARWLARQGHHVTAIDRDGEALATLADLAPRLRTQQADIEGAPWPLPGRTYDAVVVTHYLWRANLPDILASVGPGGLLVYETFAHGNASVGKPSRPDFLLQPGELLTVCQGMRIVAFEDGFLHSPDRYIQRIAAIKEADATTTPPPRYSLQPAG